MERDGKGPSTIKSYGAYRAHHQKLVDEGAIVIDGGVGKLAKDVVFGSPSMAGTIAQGRSCNGRISWVAEDGTNFGAWESRGVN